MQQDVDGAIGEFRASLRYDPRNASTHFNLAEALFKKGTMKDALEEYREAADLDKRNPVYRAAYTKLAAHKK